MKQDDNKKIFIAKDFNNNTLAVVLAKARDIADAYFIGADIIAHTVLEVENNSNLSLIILYRKDN